MEYNNGVTNVCTSKKIKGVYKSLLLMNDLETNLVLVKPETIWKLENVAFDITVSFQSWTFCIGSWMSVGPCGYKTI